MNQSFPKNYLILVDTTVGSSSAFNAAMHFLSSFQTLNQMPNKAVLVHLSKVKPGLFANAEKKQNWYDCL
jgi:hypothetical protein